MQKNNKGFMITEVLIVSTIVFSILIFMYAQFRSVYNSFYQTLKYNPVESIYKANEIKSFIESDAKNNIVDLLSNSQNNYLDITECNIQTYNDVKMCKLLYEKLEIKQLLLLSEDVTSAVASNLSQLDDGMIKFIKYINNNYSGSYHRIVVAFKDGTYATLRIDVLNKIYEFNYTGDVQTFVAPIDGYYKLEVWGAQDSSKTDAYGYYSFGTTFLQANDSLYLYVGSDSEGYNNKSTHIATQKGLLNTLNNSLNSVLIASGTNNSSYIGNSLLTYKAMYCYDCDESQEESTKTISTTCSSEQPTERCTKQGNGYAKISIVSE